MSSIYTSTFKSTKTTASFTIEQRWSNKDDSVFIGGFHSADEAERARKRILAEDKDIPAGCTFVVIKIYNIITDNTVRTHEITHTVVEGL